MSGRILKYPYVRAISAVVPSNTADLRALYTVYGNRQIDNIIKGTGIQRTTYNDPHLTASDYAVHAAEYLLNETGFPREEIDGLVFISEMSDHIIPNTASIMQHKMRLPNSCMTFEIRSGCPGYVYGLFQAFMLVESGYCNNVLLCVGRAATQYVNEKDRSLRMVLGDAASASLVCSGEADSAFSFYSDGGGAESLMIPAGGDRMPRQKDVTDVLEFDDDGNGRTKEDLYMNGMDIMAFVMGKVPGVVRKVLTDISWGQDEIDLYAMHQVNRIIIKALAGQLKVPLEKMPLSISETGNCGASSIPLMLCNLYAGKNSGLKKTIVCGYGSGLSIAAGAMDLSRACILPTIKL